MVEVIRCPGGWLAIGLICGSTARIAVVGASEDAAKRKLTSSMKLWEEWASEFRVGKMAGKANEQEVA